MEPFEPSPIKSASYGPHNLVAKPEVEAGVFTTVAGLVDQFTDNPAAKMTAQEIAERVRRAQTAGGA